MADLPWLPPYNGQATDELIALEGKFRTDSIVCAFEAALQRKADKVGGDGLSEEERIILAIEALEREVNNGGYHQFFLNTPQYTPFIVHALNRIECAVAAQLTQGAVDSLAISGPHHR